MNYRHAFHAGNHADVVKHVVLLLCLAHLKRKPASFAVLDTHAGCGLYDLTGEAAARSPEWRGGVGPLFTDPDLPPALAVYVEAVRAANPDGALRLYPGSPLLIANAQRETDRLAACELHPDEAAELKRVMRAHTNVQVHRRDGWEALRALLPFPERRGLVLIDPPYESDNDLLRGAHALRDGLKIARGLTFLWWRPLKDAGALARADAEAFAHAQPEALRVDFAIAPPAPRGPLTASSILVINPPHTLAADLAAARASLLAHLAQTQGADLAITPSREPG